MKIIHRPARWGRAYKRYLYELTDMRVRKRTVDLYESNDFGDIQKVYANVRREIALEIRPQKENSWWSWQKLVLPNKDNGLK